MKTIAHICVVASAVFLLAVSEASARGGGGGGGRGGGGGMNRPSSPAVSRPSTQAVSRPAAPAVSRPATPAVNRPAAPTAGRPALGGQPSAGMRPSTGARPSRGDLQNFLDVPKPSTGAIVAAGAGGGNAAAEFLQQGGGMTRPAAGQLPGAEKRPATGVVVNRVDQRSNIVVANRPSHIENRQEWQQNRAGRRDEVRDQVRENHPRLDFWSDHPGWAAWRINRPYRWATWAAITGWVGYGWNQPTVFSYGDNVYYQGDSVYYGDQSIASAEEYTQQAEQIASSAPRVAPDKAEWMPLGVFALTPDGQASGPDPSLFLQLAVSKEGIIRGTLNNSATNSTQTIEGMADKATQRVAWTVAGKTRPIMETGISNLTEDTAPALVHFADGQNQQWLMVRLEEPKSGN
jgi:hypothetical protein